MNRGLWASKERVKSVRNAQSQALAATQRRKKDPRDKRFYQLHGKKKLSLTAAEIVLYISYCNQMIKYVGVDGPQSDWLRLKADLQEQKQRLRAATRTAPGRQEL